MRKEIAKAAITPTVALSDQQKELILKNIEREAAFLHREKVLKEPSIWDIIKSPSFWMKVLIALIKFAFERIIIKNK
jgi:hypothetical protein